LDGAVDVLDGGWVGDSVAVYDDGEVIGWLLLSAGSLLGLFEPESQPTGELDGLMEIVGVRVGLNVVEVGVGINVVEVRVGLNVGLHVGQSELKLAVGQSELGDDVGTYVGQYDSSNGFVGRGVGRGVGPLV
jgi:hypothetical protein